MSVLVDDKNKELKLKIIDSFWFTKASHIRINSKFKLLIRLVLLFTVASPCSLFQLVFRSMKLELVPF